MTAEPDNAWRRRFAAIYDDTVHVAPDEVGVLAHIRDAARDLGMGTFVLDGAEFRTRDDVDQALAAEVMAPFPFRGWNAQRSVLNNLEWFGNEVGYSLVTRGTDAWLTQWREGFEKFAGLSIDASRRWQDIGNAFHVVFLGGPAVAAVVEEAVRKELREWSGEFNVTVGRYDS